MYIVQELVHDSDVMWSNKSVMHSVIGIKCGLKSSLETLES